ncbi:MAG: hypothetical protein KAW56_02060 [Candidatus Marinimicrobia bacterium]|nr:hypothetical protein [candidate division WOR-3 bacterium]MCK4445846.1 hypothetical protein [Candidatus Neomarinimicrobiota bacterium]
MKPIFFLSVYTILIIIFPNGMGVKTVIDLRVWMIFAAVLLLPSFAKYIFEKKIKLSKVDLILISFVLLSSINVMISGGSVRQIIGSIIKGSLYILLPYFAGKYFIKSEKKLLVFFYALGFASIIVSLIGLSEYFTGKVFFGDFGMINPDDMWTNSQMIYQRYGQQRIAASFVQPIFLGIFLGLIVLIDILILIYYKFKLNFFIKIIIIVSVLLSGVAVLLSQSRTAIFALVIASILILLKNPGKIKSFVYILILLTINLYLINHYFHDYITDFLYYGIISDKATINYFSRVDLAKMSIKYIFNYSNFLGEGILIHSKLDYFIHNNDLLNGFLNKFLKHGIFYGLLYIYLWFKAFKVSYKFSKYNIWGSILLFILIYLFIVNNITQLTFQNEIIFYILLGIIFNPFLKNQKEYVRNLS